MIDFEMMRIAGVLAVGGEGDVNSKNRDTHATLAHSQSYTPLSSLSSRKQLLEGGRRLHPRTRQNNHRRLLLFDPPALQ